MSMLLPFPLAPIRFDVPSGFLANNLLELFLSDFERALFAGVHVPSLRQRSSAFGAFVAFEVVTLHTVFFIIVLSTG